MVYCDDMDCKFQFNFLSYKVNFLKINSSVEIKIKFFDGLFSSFGYRAT